MEKNKEKEKAISTAMSQIERQFGKGSIMKLGGRPIEAVPVIRSGSLALDKALGVGGYPRGRVIEIYGPESSGKTTLALHAVAQAQDNRGHCRIHRCRACPGRFLCQAPGRQLRRAFGLPARYWGAGP